jgi:DNA-binding response OmpR family regulator
MTTDADILIVEDQPGVRACLEQILSMAGYRVHTAGDGLEALAVLESEPVDLIVADIMMPNMDGYQLYERVVENPDWVGIPFIYLTARMLSADIRHGKELGVDDYLIKPVEAKDLLAVVRGKLRRVQKVVESSGQFTQRSKTANGTVDLGWLRIELGQYRVWLHDEPLALSNTEFRLLETLATHADKVVSLPDLVEITHGLDASYTEASDLLRPMVRSLRRKMGHEAGDLGCIESVRGVGYRLVSSSAPQEVSGQRLDTAVI